jgi:hypothetical protein
MLFPDWGDGGQSRFVSAGGTTLWQADASEVVEVWDLDVAAQGNRRPQVQAGDAKTIRLPETNAALAGYAADDGAPNSSLALAWSQVSGPTAATFADASAASTTITFSTDGVYVLRLSASDGDLVGTSDVVVTVLPTTGDPHFVGYWPFDGDVADASGMGHHGSLVESPTFSTDAAPSGGANTSSIVLDGDGDYVSVADDAALDGADGVTIAMWFKPRTSFPGFVGNGGNDWATLIQKGDAWGSEDYLLSLGAYFYVFARGKGVHVPALDDAILTAGSWTHVAAVLDPHGGYAKIFINGVLDHRVDGIALPMSNTDALRIGGGNLDGKIDEVRLYTRPLADEEVAALIPGASVNAPPVVDAGPPLTVTKSTAHSLEGSFEDDGVPATSNSVTWTRWRQLSGPSAARLDNRFAVDTEVAFDVDGTYVLELVGSDGSHRVADTVSIVVGEDAASGSGGGSMDSAATGALGSASGAAANGSDPLASGSGESSSGCGCRVGGRRANGGLLLQPLGLAALACRKRRRRPTRTSMATVPRAR